MSPIVSLEYHDTYYGGQYDNALYDPNLFERGIWNYRVGVNFHFPLNNFLTVVSGIHYFQSGSMTKFDESLIPDNLAIWPDISGSSYPVYNKSIRNVRGIPFYLRASKDFEKYFLFAESGGSVNFTYNVVYKKLEAEGEAVIKDVKSIKENFVLLKLSLGLGFKISDRINLSISPLIRYRPRGRYENNFNSTFKYYRVSYGAMIKTEILLE